MQTVNLSPELYGKIVDCAALRTKDLLALCLTCKAFQRAAEIRLYNHVALSEPQQTIDGCCTLIQNGRLAQHVRGFWFNPDARTCSSLEHDFWGMIRRALIACQNMEALLISDPTFTNTWVLDCPEFTFRLREAKLRFVYDENIIHFLESQPAIRMLHIYDFADDDILHTIRPNSLPLLETFDGTLSVGGQFIPSKLCHLQMVIDCDMEFSLQLLPQLSLLRKNLRSLSLLDVPSEMSLPALDIVSQVLPNIRHLGLFPYPVNAVSN